MTAGLPASALPRSPEEKAAERAAKAKAACVPKFNTGVTGEPWQGSRKRASEKAFQKRDQEGEPALRQRQGRVEVLHRRPEPRTSRRRSAGSPRPPSSGRPGRSWITKQQKLVEKAGGHYHVVVAPANWDIYPKKLPTWAQQLRGTTSLRQADEGASRAALDRPQRGPAQRREEARHLRAAQQPLDSVRRLRGLAGDQQVPAGHRQELGRDRRARDHRCRRRRQPERVRVIRRTGRQASADLPDPGPAAPCHHDHP